MSASPSWAACTVTVCAVFQFVAVKVRASLTTVTSLAPEDLDGVTVTAAVGSEFSTTV